MTKTPEIIYIGDPLCSWCWGISNEVDKLKEAWKGRAGFRLVMGGLRPDETEPMDAEMKNFLRHHWEEVHKRTQQPFSYDIMQRNDFVYNTEPPSRAVVIARELSLKTEFEFFKAVQHAFYAQNKDIHLLETYLPLCAELAIDRNEFTKLWHSDEMKAATRQEFELSAKIGVRSFPTVAVDLGDSLQALAVGYSTFEQMNAHMETVCSTVLGTAR